MPVRRFRLYAAAAAAAVLLLAGGGFVAGQAATAGAQHWQHALLDLQNAQLELQLVGTGPGAGSAGASPTGSRQRALMLINGAILQVQRGMAGEQ